MKIEKPIEMNQEALDEYKEWKNTFSIKLKSSMRCPEDYPGHGSSMLDLHDATYSPEKMKFFIDGLLFVLTNEIGLSPEVFDTIVSINSPQIINIGILIARRLKLPFVSI